MTEDKKCMTKAQLLDILDRSRFNRVPETAQLFEDNVREIKALLCGVPSEESLCDAKGNEPTSIREFPGRESRALGKKSVNAFDIHFQNLGSGSDATGIVNAFRIMFEILCVELQTWKEAWTQRIGERLNKGEGKVKKIIDGETISKWTAAVSAIVAVLLSVGALVFKSFGYAIDYDEVAFFITGIGAIVTLVITLIAGICNRVLKNKFYNAYGISVDEAKNFKNLIITEKEYLDEIRKARELYRSPKHFKRNIRKARRIYELLRDNRDPTDPNCYVGLLAICSDNFTVYSRKQSQDDYIEAIEAGEGDNNYSHLAEGYREDYIKYKEKVEEYKKQESKKRQEKIQRRRERLARAVPVLQQIGIYTLLILPIVLSVAVLVMTFCLPVKSFDNYTGWLFTIIFVLDCLSAVALFYISYMRWALGRANRNPKFEGFGVGMLGGGACVFGACTGETSYIFIWQNWEWWQILVFSVCAALFLTCFIWGLIKHEGKCIPRFLLVCLVGICLGSACMGAIDSFITGFAAATHDYYTENPDGTYTYVICDDETENLEIPSEYLGKPVTAVSRDAKIELLRLKSVSIPASVTQLDSGLLSGCSKLESLTVPYVGYSDITGVNDYDGEAESLYPIGYLFGTSSYEGGTAIEQHHWGKYISGDREGEESEFSCTFYIPASLKNVTVLGGEVCYGAFSFCGGLESVTIGSGATAIGKCAFWHCDSLTSITISEGVTSIGNCAFYGCSKLTSVTIPESVTSIGRYAFEDCSSLQTVTFEGDSQLPSIGEWAFSHCSLLQSVTFEGDSELTSIGVYAFYNCSSLTSITIPESVTSIGNYAFYNCSSLQSVTFEGDSQLTLIGDRAFDDCSSLTTITIPAGVTSIGWSAFNGCDSLQSITIPFVGAEKDGSTDTHFGCIFGASSYSSNSIYVPTSLKEVIITGGTSIKERAFYGCTSLESVTLGDGVTFIGKDAFLNCGAVHKTKGIWYIGKWAIGCDSTVTAAELSSDTVGIADFAFADFGSLSSVTLNEGLKVIGGSAFQGTKITALVIPQSVSVIGANAFSGCMLSVVVFDDAEEWYADGTYMPSSDLTDPATASAYLTSTYADCIWKRG